MTSTGAEKRKAAEAGLESDFEDHNKAHADHVPDEVVERYRRASHFTHVWGSPPAANNGNEQAAESIFAEPIVVESDVSEAVVAASVVAEPDSTFVSDARPSTHVETCGNHFEHLWGAPPAAVESGVAEPFVANPVFAQPVLHSTSVRGAGPSSQKTYGPYFAHLWGSPVAGNNGNEHSAIESVAKPFVAGPVIAESVVESTFVNAAGSSTHPHFSHMWASPPTKNDRKDPVVDEPVTAKPAVDSAFGSGAGSSSGNTFNERAIAVHARFKVAEKPTAAVSAQSRQVIQLVQAGKPLDNLSPGIDLYAEFRATYLQFGYKSNYFEFAGHLLHAIKHCPQDVKYDVWVFVAVNFAIDRRGEFNLKFEDWVKRPGNVQVTEHHILTRDKVMKTLQQDEDLTFVLMARNEY